MPNPSRAIKESLLLTINQDGNFDRFQDNFNPTTKFRIKAKCIEVFEDKIPIKGIKGFSNVYFENQVATMRH